MVPDLERQLRDANQVRQDVAAGRIRLMQKIIVILYEVQDLSWARRCIRYTSSSKRTTLLRDTAFDLSFHFHPWEGLGYGEHFYPSDKQLTFMDTGYDLHPRV
jgi:hypothetical protein